MLEPCIGTQQVTNPAREELATHRNRVLRGHGATYDCEAYTGRAQAVGFNPESAQIAEPTQSLQWKATPRRPRMARR
jgi:hypothetical protein